MFRKYSNKLIPALAATLFLFALILHLLSDFNSQKLCEKAENKLHLKEQKLTEALQLYKLQFKHTLGFSITSLEHKSYLDKEGIIIHYYRNDSLKFWTSSIAPVDIPIRTLSLDGGLLHLRNGWYDYFIEKEGSSTYLGLLLIKPEYDVQNSYFSNAFVSWMGLPPSANINVKADNSYSIIRSSTNKPLFSIEFSEEKGSFEGIQINWPFILFICALLLAGYSLIKYHFKLEISLQHFLLFSLALIFIRVIMIHFKFPSLLYESTLYDLGIYGITQSFFNEYLGDVLINVLLFFVWTIIFYKKITFNSVAKKLIYPLCILYMILLVILAFQLNSTIKNLVINSTISLDFSNFFNLSYLSFLCLAIVFINGFSIALLVEKLVNFLNDINKKNAYYFFVSITILFTGIYLLFFKSSMSWIEAYWVFLLICISIILPKFDFNQSILSTSFRILIFAIITSFIFSEYNSKSEALNLNHLAEQLSDTQDAILESEFLKVAHQIEKDSQLLKAIKRLPLYQNETEQLLRQLYFTKYFERYTIHLSVFDSLCMPFLKNSDFHYNNHEYFEEQIKKGQPTISSNLYFISNYKLNARYIGKIDFVKTESKPVYTLYIQFEPKQFTDAGNFPDLLLDKSQQKQHHYKEVSYAIYKAGNLVTAFGKYNYPKFFTKDVLSFNTQNYQHELIVPDGDTQIILSKKHKGFNYYFAANSYYFLFYSLLGILFFIAYHSLNPDHATFFTLSRRIQFFIVSVLFLALFAVGYFTIKLVISKSEDEQIKLLTDKARQIQNELNNKVFFNRSIEMNSKQFTESNLKQYSELFNTDISVYYPNGILFASSRPQLFNSGLSSKLINPLAILHFKENQSSYFITYDKIGSLNYLSLYTALFNSKRELMGFINLPYFARQNDLEEGVSDYITTLLNIYVVLFLISLFTGLIISVYITQPLRMLQEQLAKISFGKKNAPIAWQSNDEIGKLVKEYNLMLLKLEESALLLAKSEREGAWQEMAKQVAHEIKNPLTPMKLNLQYLQKVVSEDKDNFAEKYKRISESLIEQIDTLAQIATEFSNFAKLPVANLDAINLTEIIQSSIELFANKENLKINFHSHANHPIVLADKNQCLRIFNNLIKNAIQAIPAHKQGLISIELNEDVDFVFVSVKDNGIGISNEMKTKIFIPNFTTKTTGTGLGLAMVKNIMNSLNGEIRFESTENQGTIFYLKFLKKS